MNMVKTLSAKYIKSIIPILLFCWGIGGFFLLLYGPGTLGLMMGNVPPEILEEDMDHYYGMSLLALIFILLGLVILIVQLATPVKKRVNKYLAEHPEVTLRMLDDDFAKAKQFGDIWVGKQFTYALHLKRILLENDRIVWIYRDLSASEDTVILYICWCMVDGRKFRARVSERWLEPLVGHYADFPHILTNFDPDYKFLFKYNMNRLLEIKYNRYIKQESQN